MRLRAPTTIDREDPQVSFNAVMPAPAEMTMVGMVTASETMLKNFADSRCSQRRPAAFCPHSCGRTDS